jgi:hypothetical protein
LFNRGDATLDFTLDSHFSSQLSWVRAGLIFRWRNGSDSTSVKPQVQFSRDEQAHYSTTAGVDARWNTDVQVRGIGVVDQSLYALGGDGRAAIGARFVPRARDNTDFEFGYQRDRDSADLYYAMNSRFSVVTTNRRTTLGDGGVDASAVIVHVTGDLFGKFEVLVDNRVVGYAWAQRPNVISLRPYESYDIRIRPIGDAIVGYDQQSRRVTLYPGNVQTLEFSARELTVIISQATYEDGTPVVSRTFQNVEGYGATDDQGWFQIEIGHSDPLVLVDRSGERCQLVLPEYYAEQGLAVLDPVVCAPIPAPQ